MSSNCRTRGVHSASGMSGDEPHGPILPTGQPVCPALLRSYIIRKGPLDLFVQRSTIRPGVGGGGTGSSS